VRGSSILIDDVRSRAAPTQNGGMGEGDAALGNHLNEISIA
jgi:hypothetical protein